MGNPFESLGRVAKGTKINKKVLIFGGIGSGLLVVFMSMRRPAADEEVPAGGTIEGAYEGPDNLLQDQMRYDNLQSILLGQVDQHLNLSLQDQREKDKAQDEKDAAYDKKLKDLENKMKPVAATPAKPVTAAPAPKPKPAPPKATQPGFPSKNPPKEPVVKKPVVKPSKPKPKAPAKKPTPKKSVWDGLTKKKYAAPKGGWNKGSVVDLFKSKGYDSSLANRKKAAAKVGIKNYTGTAAQNTKLIASMKG